MRANAIIPFAARDFIAPACKDARSGATLRAMHKVSPRVLFAAVVISAVCGPVSAASSDDPAIISPQDGGENYIDIPGVGRIPMPPGANPDFLAARRRLGLGLDLIGLDDHESLVHGSGFVLGRRERRLASGKARRDPLGLGLFPLGLGFLRVVERRVVVDQSCHGVGVGRGRAEQGQLNLRRAVQNRPGTLRVARRSVAPPPDARCR